MNNEKIFELMDRLGMIEEEDNRCCCAEEPDRRTRAEVFASETCTDLISLINFVDNVALNNDLETIKKFLVCLMYNKNNRIGR